MNRKKLLDGDYIYAILGIIVGIIIGILLENVIRFSVWSGWNADWLSAIGSWASGIIAGGALYYALLKDHNELRKVKKRLVKKIDIVNDKSEFISSGCREMDTQIRGLLKLMKNEEITFQSTSIIIKIESIETKIQENIYLDITNYDAPDWQINSLNKIIKKVSIDFKEMGSLAEDSLLLTDIKNENFKKIVSCGKTVISDLEEYNIRLLELEKTMLRSYDYL